MALFVQYGCGLSAPLSWKNYDSSPTLRLQKIPILSILAKRKVQFPSNVMFGDIIKGLPDIEPESCDAVYCSHTLEHLALADFYIAIRNTYSILKKGGVFRCVLPDLEYSIRNYIRAKETDPDASMKFMNETMLGVEKRSHGIKGKLIDLFGNSAHLWMWDVDSLQKALNNQGFVSVRRCYFNDSSEKAFLDVEEESRFRGAIAFECVK